VFNTPAAVGSQNKPIGFRATPSERRQIEAAAAQRGTVISEVVREALVQAGAIAPRTPSPDAMTR